MLNKKETTGLKRIEKKMNCELVDCGEHFTFEVTEHDEANAENRKAIYRGKCGRCHRVVKLT